MKTVFITGATKNTGLCTAKYFASNGYSVALSSRSGEAAEKTAKEIEKEYGVKSRGYQLDMQSLESIKSVFGQIENTFGSLDVFVANSANLGIGFALANTDEKNFDDIVSVNIKGTFFCCQAAAEIMKRHGGGCIITMGSVQGMRAVSGRTVYALSKASISNLVKNMAYELGQYGIRANNVVAGAIHSERWEGLSEEELEQRRSRYPVGRESSEQEVANAVYFLASDGAASVTGIDFVIDSGISACMIPYKKS